MDNRLRQLVERRKQRAMELHNIATLKTQGDLTVRRFIVRLYEENTEYVAALEMLADIDHWFRVEALEVA